MVWGTQSRPAPWGDWRLSFPRDFPKRSTMKRILTLGVLALGMTLASQQSASAWCNFKFGAGVNWNWQSGNNCWLWGLCRGGEVPGPEYFGCCAPSCGYPSCGYPAYAGVGGYPAYAGGNQYYGGAA